MAQGADSRRAFESPEARHAGHECRGIFFPWIADQQQHDRVTTAAPSQGVRQHTEIKASQNTACS